MTTPDNGREAELEAEVERLRDNARWLAERLYEYQLIGPRQRIGLSQIEMDKFLEIRSRINAR